MIEIKPVVTKKQLKQFVDFQPKLYKDNPYYVPPLRSDEINLLSEKKSPHLSSGDATCQCFLAYKDGKIVGRGAGIIQHLYNKKHNVKYARISRLDFIDDFEVSKAIIEAIENWAKEQGMTKIHGPLGFNDLEREGMLIEGFDKLSTFEMLYNHPYYQTHIEKLGYKKDVDWLEFQLHLSPTLDKRNARLASTVAKRSGLTEIRLKKKELLKQYADKILNLIDEAYGSLYGTVPLTPKVRKSLLQQFNLVLDTDFIVVLVDKDNEVAGFGLAFPSMAKAVKKANGKLFPFGFIPILRSLKKNDTVDLALIGVANKHANSGVTAVIFEHMYARFIKRGIKFAETNAQLESNYKVQALFNKSYESHQKTRRRSYIKDLV